MSGLQIPCPKCGKKLKLPDRSLLGRKGKCPKCAHSFVLEEPDEVRLELAEPTVAAPQKGTGAKWVPDAAQPASSATPVPPNVAMMPMPPGAIPVMPGGVPVVPGAWPPNVPYPQAYIPPGYVPPGYVPAGYAPVPPGYVPAQYPPPGYPAVMPGPAASPAAAPAFPNFAAEEASATEISSPFATFEEETESTSPADVRASDIDDSDFILRKKRKLRQAKQRKMMLGIAGVLTLLVAGSAVAFRETLFGPAGKPKPKNAVAANSQKSPEPSEPEWEPPVPLRPTKGDPVELLCMPSGVTIVVHLRPAELWQTQSKQEEFRFCLGPLGEWLGTQIKEVCRYEPDKIEEVTFGLIRGFAGDPMQVCALVRLKEPAKQKTDLINSFGAKLDELSEYPVYSNEKYSFAIKDLRTFAVCPIKLQSGMVEGVNRANPQGVGVETLLRQTDRERHVMLMFEPAVLGAEIDFMFPKELQPLARHFLDFFAPKEVETVAWSLHVGDEKFHSEVLLRNKSPLSKSQLQQQLKKKLDKLPHEILAAVERMDPQVAGPRQLIGRFPAMAKVFAMATHASAGERSASLATSLPERAAPNLAIGALLAWDESTRTNFSQPVDKPKETGPSKLPELVADRLKLLSVEIEFKKMPLQDGLKYIADECKINLDIDGDGLKAAGFTKNMEQNMTLGKVTGMQAIAAILKKYEKERVPLVLVIDETKKLALITTKEFAEKDKLTIYPTQ